MTQQDQQLATRQQVTMSLADLATMAKSIAASRMFGVDTEDQAMALMLLCQAEGLHPVMALRRYHIVDNKPAFRADALQGEFEKQGAILWHFRTDQVCAATFYRDKDKVDDAAINRGKMQCRMLLKAEQKEPIHVEEYLETSRIGEITILRTFKDAEEKGLTMGASGMKKNWRQSPRQMLHARVLTEGVRSINPGLIAGIYSEEEIIDIPPEETYDQRPAQEITERNVREATTHATGEEFNTTMTIPASVLTNEYGPLVITQDNYGSLVSHVGQAQGNMLGNKIGDLPRNIITWMHEKWRNNLRPNATEQDLRLKKAIELAYEELKKVDGTPQEASQSVKEPPPTTEAPAEAPRDIGARQAYINDLRGRIEDLIMTEGQAMQHLVKQGVTEQNWQSLDDMPDSMLQWLCLPQNWKVFKDTYEAEVKPKVSAPIRKPRKRK